MQFSRTQDTPLLCEGGSYYKGYNRRILGPIDKPVDFFEWRNCIIWQGSLEKNKWKENLWNSVFTNSVFANELLDVDIMKAVNRQLNKRNKTTQNKRPRQASISNMVNNFFFTLCIWIQGVIRGKQIYTG